jgi:hypothetical protein
VLSFCNTWFRVDDLWFWQTILIVDDADAVFAKLKEAGYVFVSKEIVHQQINGVHSKSFIVKDPDGHAVRIVQHL